MQVRCHWNQSRRGVSEVSCPGEWVTVVLTRSSCRTFHSDVLRLLLQVRSEGKVEENRMPVQGSSKSPICKRQLALLRDPAVASRPQPRASTICCSFLDGGCQGRNQAHVPSRYWPDTDLRVYSNTVSSQGMWPSYLQISMTREPTSRPKGCPLPRCEIQNDDDQLIKILSNSK
jgi:hypothetical protein